MRLPKISPTSTPTDPLDGRASQATLSFAPEAATLLCELRDFFAARGIAAYVVGGAVRDALLGYPTADIDLAIDGDMAVSMVAIGRTLPVTVVPLDAEREIYRVVDRRSVSHIDITPLRGGSLASDAAWRDFTIDALAVSLAEADPVSGRGAVFDTVGGLEDLRRREVRAIAEDVFIKDPLRLLRAVRLAVERGFSIEPGTRSLIGRDALLLQQAAGERVRGEFCRILAAPGAPANLRLLDELGLLVMVIPELEDSRNVGQPKEHHWDVLQHLIETVGFLEQVLRVTPGNSDVLEQVPWDEGLARHFRERITDDRTRLLLAKLGALLHDVAKPAMKTVDPDGRIRFFGHPSRGAEMTVEIMERLRFSSREIRLVSAMVDEHLRPGLISREEHEPTRRAMYRFFRDAGDATIETLFLCFADYLAARGPAMDPADWAAYAAKMRRLLDEWRREKSAPPPLKLIDGHDLMDLYRLPPGPHLKTLLEAVKESQAAGDISSREEALALVERMLQESRAA